MKGLSRRAATALDTDEIESADVRPAQIARLQQVSGEVIDAIGEVFAGTDLPSDQGLVTEVLQARRAVTEAWERARGNFIEIGRALNRLYDRLRAPEERAALKRGFDKLFPLSEPIAFQFRAVARMIDTGRLPIEVCPGSYSAAYQLSLLPPEDFEEAKRRGMIGRNTTRAAVIAFRKERATRPMTLNIEGLLAERRRIQEARRRMLQELLRMRRRSTEIARILDGAPEGGGS
jgi:hypothetical protein